MSLIQMTRKPVTVYRSTDTDAPQLTATPGSLRTLLEACLVTGYGSKSALGWEMPFSSSTEAAFKSKEPDATGCYLRIKNDAARYCEFAGYGDMTSITGGSEEFNINSNKPRFVFLRHSANKSEWMLVGHGRAFWLFIHQAYGKGGNGGNGGNWLFFGDYPSFAPADKGNCAIGYSPFPGSVAYINNIIYAPYSVSTNYYNIRSARSADQLSRNAALRTNSRCLNYAGRPYPDVITGGLQADAMDLHEYITTENASVLRGRLPGLYACAHNLSSISDGTEIGEFDGTDDKFAKVRLYGYTAGAYDNLHHYLINLTAWDA